MRKGSVLALLSLLCLLVTLNSVVLAGGGEANGSIQAIGYTIGTTGGVGLAYKHFITPEQAIQIGGGGSYYSEYKEATYNFGAMYQKILHETGKIRLYLAPGFTWLHFIDLDKTEVREIGEGYESTKGDLQILTAGLSCGIELLIAEQIGLSLFMGVGGGVGRSYEVGPYLTREEALNPKASVEFAAIPMVSLSLVYYY